jgi:hypothetical protein
VVEVPVKDDYWTCTHVATDEIIITNGGRFNLTHYLRVLHAREVQNLTTVTVKVAA